MGVWCKAARHTMEEWLVFSPSFQNRFKWTKPREMVADLWMNAQWQQWPLWHFSAYTHYCESVEPNPDDRWTERFQSQLFVSYNYRQLSEKPGAEVLLQQRRTCASQTQKDPKEQRRPTPDSLCMKCSDSNTVIMSAHQITTSWNLFGNSTRKQMQTVPCVSDVKEEQKMERQRGRHCEHWAPRKGLFFLSICIQDTHTHTLSSNVRKKNIHIWRSIKQSSKKVSISANVRTDLKQYTMEMVSRRTSEKGGRGKMKKLCGDSTPLTTCKKMQPIRENGLSVCACSKSPLAAQESMQRFSCHSCMSVCFTIKRIKPAFMYQEYMSLIMKGCCVCLCKLKITQIQTSFLKISLTPHADAHFCHRVRAGRRNSSRAVECALFACVCVCVCWRALRSKVEGRIRRQQGGFSFWSHLVQLGGTSSGLCSGGRLRPNPESERFFSCVTKLGFWCFWFKCSAAFTAFWLWWLSVGLNWFGFFVVWMPFWSWGRKTGGTGLLVVWRDTLCFQTLATAASSCDIITLMLNNLRFAADEFKRQLSHHSGTEAADK